MSEIIWAMNSRFDTAESLSGYVRRYASEYLEEYDIDLVFHESVTTSFAISAEKRRNVFLVIKEILHNTVKYSGAHAVDLSIEAGDTALSVKLKEKGGRGFDPEQTMEKGNGLYNIQKRMKAIDGQIEFLRGDEGMTFTLRVPFETKTS